MVDVDCELTTKRHRQRVFQVACMGLGLQEPALRPANDKHPYQGDRTER